MKGNFSRIKDMALESIFLKEKTKNSKVSFSMMISLVEFGAFKMSCFMRGILKIINQWEKANGQTKKDKLH